MKCLRQKALLKGAMSMSKFIWTNFPWQLVWGTGPLTQRKLEPTQHRRKAGIRDITGGRWHGPWERQRELSFPQQLSGSSLTSAVNPLFPRWPQRPAAPWNQDSLPTFHSAMIFADLSQSNVSYQAPKRKRWGKLLFHIPRWEGFSAALLCPLFTSQRSGQANELGSLQSPRLKWWGRQHPEHATESRRPPGSLKIYFTKIQTSEL